MPIPPTIKITGILGIKTDEVFMVCELIDGQLTRTKGELRYPETFF